MRARIAVTAASRIFLHSPLDDVSVVHAKTDSVVHARNQLSCARGAGVLMMVMTVMMMMMMMLTMMMMMMVMAK